MNRIWLILGTVALAAVPFFLWWAGDDPERSIADRTPPDSGRVPPGAARPPAAPSDRDANASPRPKRTRRSRGPATQDEIDTVRRTTETLVDALIEAQAKREADEDPEGARDRADAARTRLIELLKRRPELADGVLAEMTRVEQGRVVRQLGQTLRFVRSGESGESGELVEELRRRALRGPRPADRQAALLGLEGRPWEAWHDVAKQAYDGDVDAAVRDTAAAVLGRGLLDRRLRARHGELRATIARGLDSRRPADRVRALEALLHDRYGGDELAVLVGPLRKDPDPHVRAAAERLLRVRVKD